MPTASSSTATEEIPFEAGDTIIRAAWRQGIEIPHYLLAPGPQRRRQLPHVPGGDRAARRRASGP